MSNVLYVRRVMAADNYHQAYNDTYETHEALERDIAEEGILSILGSDEGGFSVDVAASGVGTGNYIGNPVYRD
jgi:hypothetical protein